MKTKIEESIAKRHYLQSTITFNTPYQTKYIKLGLFDATTRISGKKITRTADFQKLTSYGFSNPQ